MGFIRERATSWLGSGTCHSGSDVRRPRYEGAPRQGGPHRSAAEVESTTLLGPWYATIAKCRPQLALFVNEATLLPVLMPLAPSRSLFRRFPEALARVLATHGVDQAVIDAELEAMEYDVTRKTASRSMTGMLVEFTFLARHVLDQTPDVDLTELSVDLASTPCSPLYKRHVSPDRELAALLASRPNAPGIP